jgi:hypothetical protein
LNAENGLPGQADAAILRYDPATMADDPRDETPTRLFALPFTGPPWHVVWMESYDPEEQTYQTLCGQGENGRVLPGQVTLILAEIHLCPACLAQLEDESDLPPLD